MTTTQDAPKVEVTPTVETPKAEVVAPTSLIEKFMNVAKANERINALNVEKAQLIKDLADSQNAFKTLQDMAQGEVEMKANYENQLTDLKAEYEAKLVKTEVDTQITDEKVAVKASQVLSNIGITAGEIEVNTTVKSVYDKYAEMPQGNARNAFFTENKSEILKELELRKASK